MTVPQYNDDSEILNKDELWRGIHPDHLVTDQKTGLLKISSAAFKDHPNSSPMSVVLAKECRGPGSVLEHFEKGYTLASITAGLARKCGQIVAREPLPHELAHAVVVGEKRKEIRRRFAKEAQWVVPPFPFSILHSQPLP